MPASRSFLRWCESVGWEMSNSGTSSQTQTCRRAAQDVDELQPHGVAERLGDFCHADGLRAVDVGVDDRLATRATGSALRLGGKLQIDRHRSRISIEVTIVNTYDRARARGPVRVRPQRRPQSDGGGAPRSPGPMAA